MLHRQVVEVDLMTSIPALASRFLMRFLAAAIASASSARIRVDEERDLVAQALHLQEALAAEHGEQVLFLLRQRFLAHSAAACSID